MTCYRLSSLLESEAEQLVSYCLYRKWHPCGFWGKQLLTALVKIIWKVFSTSSGWSFKLAWFRKLLEMRKANKGCQNQKYAWVSFPNKTSLWTVALVSQCTDLSGLFGVWRSPVSPCSVLFIMLYGALIHWKDAFQQKIIEDPTQGGLNNKKFTGAALVPQTSGFTWCSHPSFASLGLFVFALLSEPALSLDWSKGATEILGIISHTTFSRGEFVSEWEEAPSKTFFTSCWPELGHMPNLKPITVRRNAFLLDRCSWNPVNTQITWGSCKIDSHSVGLGWGLRADISQKLPGDADIAGWHTTKF